MNAIKSLSISLLFVPFLVSAQGQAVLPGAGLTPESPFYFFDRIGETLQRFFTFNPEAKARLEITFAAERISEIRIMLDAKGVRAKGLSVAEAALAENISRVSEIVVAEKSKGKDVSRLAKALNDEITQNKELLKQTFEEQKDALENKIEDLKNAIKEAKRAGDTAKADALSKELADLKAQKELLEIKENEDEDAIETEDDELEGQMELKDEALHKINEAEKKKSEVEREASKESFGIPFETLNRFDNLLAQAKAAFDAGNYENAKDIAERAKELIDDEADEALEKLKDAEEQEEELDNKIEEERQSSEQQLREENKKIIERQREEQKQADEERE